MSDEQKILENEARIIWSHNEVTKAFKKDLDKRWSEIMNHLCKESNNMGEQQIRFKLGEACGILKTLESINYGNG